MDQAQAAKKELRAEIQHRLNQLPPNQRQSQEVLIIKQLTCWFAGLAWRSHHVLWAYWPALPEEPGFRGWLQELMAAGVSVALPRMNWSAGDLTFYQLDDADQDLETTKSGVIQPRKTCRLAESSSVAAVLVPGLAFDRNGGRLGRGAGFYDRTLAGLPPESPRWSVAFQEQVVPQVPMSAWDQRLDGLILPTGLERFK